MIILNEHNLWSWHRLGSESFNHSDLYNQNWNLLLWWIIVYFRHFSEDVFPNYVSLFLLLQQTIPWKAIFVTEKLKILCFCESLSAFWTSPTFDSSLLIYWELIAVVSSWQWYYSEPVKVSGKNSKVAFECSPNMLCLAFSLNTFRLFVTVVMSLSMIRRLCLVTLLWRCNITYELWSGRSTFSNSLKFWAWQCSSIWTDFFASLFSALGFEYLLDCNDTGFETSLI